MHKKKPLHSGRPIQGGNTPTVSQSAYGVYIPPAAFSALEAEAAGLLFGTATLVLHFKDGHLNRFVTSREQSFQNNQENGGGGEL